MKNIFLLCFLSNTLFSITLMPMLKTIDNKKSRQILFTVSNPTKQMVAGTFDIKQIINNQGDKEKRKKATKFSFYPAQFVLKPHQNKKIRVKYLGNTLPNVEEIYRVIAKELNVDVNDNTQESSEQQVSINMKMRLTYEGILIVHKANSLAKLRVTSIKDISSINNKRTLELLIENNGIASTVPTQQLYKFIVTIKNKEYKLSKEDFKEGKTFRILAQSSHKIILRDVNLPQGKINSIRLEPI